MSDNKKNMIKITKKLYFFFKCLYNLYKLIFFKCSKGKKLTYYQDEISSNKHFSMSNGEFEITDQNDNLILTVSVKDTNKDKSFYENQRRAQEITNERRMKKKINTLPNDQSITKLENIDSILEKSVFDLESNDWEILYIEMAKYISDEPKCPKYTDKVTVN